MTASADYLVEDIGSSGINSESRRCYGNRDQHMKLIGELDALIAQHRARIAELEHAVYGARAYDRLLCSRDEIAEWVVDQVFDGDAQTQSTVDANLGGDEFVPCVIHATGPSGEKLKIELVSTVYAVTQVEE